MRRIFSFYIFSGASTIQAGESFFETTARSRPNDIVLGFSSKIRVHSILSGRLEPLIAYFSDQWWLMLVCSTFANTTEVLEELDDFPAFSIA